MNRNPNRIPQAILIVVALVGMTSCNEIAVKNDFRIRDIAKSKSDYYFKMYDKTKYIPYLDTSIYYNDICLFIDQDTENLLK